MVYEDNKLRLFVHPKIYTFSPRVSVANWMLTLGQKIVALGKGACPGIGSEAERIELQGESIIPGMIDAHTHPARYVWQYVNSLPPEQKGGLKLPVEYANWLDLENVRTAEELLERIHRQTTMVRPGSWILGGGWHDLDTVPTAYELDLVAPHHPVFLIQLSLHSALANSLAFEASGITEDSWDPRGGSVARDRDGKPTGMVYEQAVSVIEKNIPAGVGRSILGKLILETMQHLNGYGLVGVHDMESCSQYDIYPILSGLLQEYPERFTLRFLCSLKLETFSQSLAQGNVPGAGNEYLKTGPLKLMHDGSLGSSTALMSFPYLQNGNPVPYWGEELLSRGELRLVAKEAVRRNVSLAVHAIGDRATQNVAELFEEIFPFSRTRLRHRIEHIQSATPQTIERLARCGVIFSVQPIHLLGDLEKMAQVQPGLVEHTHSYRALLNESAKYGSHVALGTDLPVAPANPLWNVYTAVTRKSPDGKALDPRLDRPENHLSVQEALTAYTIGSACAAGEEGLKGSLEGNKLADFVVLSHDILQEGMDPEKIMECKVLATYLGGRKVWPS